MAHPQKNVKFDAITLRSVDQSQDDSAQLSVIGWRNFLPEEEQAYSKMKAKEEQDKTEKERALFEELQNKFGK